jgi:hypothetical protein
VTPKDIVIRAAKTAIQTGIAVIVGAQAGFYDVATWKAAGTAAIAAALSAIGNALHTSEDNPTPAAPIIAPVPPPPPRA